MDFFGKESHDLHGTLKFMNIFSVFMLNMVVENFFDNEKNNLSLIRAFIENKIV